MAFQKKGPIFCLWRFGINKYSEWPCLKAPTGCQCDVSWGSAGLLCDRGVTDTAPPPPQSPCHSLRPGSRCKVCKCRHARSASVIRPCAGGALALCVTQQLCTGVPGYLCQLMSQTQLKDVTSQVQLKHWPGAHPFLPRHLCAKDCDRLTLVTQSEALKHLSTGLCTGCWGGSRRMGGWAA